MFVMRNSSEMQFFLTQSKSHKCIIKEQDYNLGLQFVNLPFICYYLVITLIEADPFCHWSLIFSPRWSNNFRCTMHSPIEQGLNLDRNQVIFKLSYISIYVQPSKLITTYISVSYNWPLGVWQIFCLHHPYHLCKTKAHRSTGEKLEGT